MTTKCPCCNRVIRPKKLKLPDTPEQAHKKLMDKVRAGVNTSLRRPMPSKTPYKE